MGIKGLGKFLSENAPRAVRQLDMKALQGRTLAVDASMSLYQFMIAIRDAEHYANLTNEAGDATSHIIGMLSRVVKLLESGVKPVYVFDGKPPELKAKELARRSAAKKEAAANLAEAQEAGDMAGVKKFVGRTVKITEAQNNDVKKLLNLLGVPVVEALDEAEAQCARLAAAGLVYGTATEDADALTFGTPVLIRHLTVSESKAKTKPILAFTLAVILEELKFDMDQFVDFCILCGCDYVDRVKGLGPATAFKLIQQYKSIDAILEANKLTVDPDTFLYKEAREAFKNPQVKPAEDVGKLVWRDADEEGLRAFLVAENNFNPARVEGYLTRLRAARKNSTQVRLSSFFGPVKVVPAAPTAKETAAAAAKRKKAGTTAAAAGSAARKKSKI